MRKINQAGQILVFVIIVVVLVLANTLMMIGGSQIYFNNSRYNAEVAQATNLAEAGVDKALSDLNATGGNYLGDTETSLEGGSFSVTITSPDPNTKIIESTGYAPSKTNARAKRTVKIVAAKGIGASFKYGIQVGEGGLEMHNESRVNGSVYSNGNITMLNNANITGDAYVAGGTASIPDQEHQCTPPNCTDFIFGTNVAGEDRLDIGQSFKLTASNFVSKVSLRLKKFGNPSDITIRILQDSGGQPDKSHVLASGILTSNLVTSSYNYVDVTFDPVPYLTGDTPYWIMLDTSSHSVHYWSWSADSSQGYTRGDMKWSPNWEDQTPVWTSYLGDLGFKVYTGGVVTSLIGSNGVHIGGEAHAHVLQDLIVTQGAYYSTVAQNVTAASYHPNSEDPSAKAMPVSDGNIQTWKNRAEATGVYTGDISSCQSTLGPGKYVGNVALINNCTTTIKDPIWITGNLTLSNGVTFQLDPSYGAASGVIVADGQVLLSNTVHLKSSGTPGSFLMMVTTFDSRVNGLTALEVNNTGNEGILYVPYGIALISNNNHIKELTAWKTILSNGVVIDYDSGLASAYFSSGPAGTYSLVKGTYQFK